MREESSPVRSDGLRTSGRRVLLVEDNNDARFMLGELLTFSGHQVSLAANGCEALESLRSHRPEVVLVDIGLPDINGYQLARRIRCDPIGGEVYLIALTGWTRPEDRQAAFDAGFDAHLAKPVGLDKLNELLAAAPRRASAS